MIAPPGHSGAVPVPSRKGHSPVALLETPLKSEHSPIASDVVIVAHNPGKLLSDAVASAIDQAGAHHVWVMDAESTDGSTQALRDSGVAVNLLPVPNHGFASSTNRGIERGSQPYVLLLNPDAVLLPDALAALVTTAEANPHAGIVGALVLNADGSVQANSYGRFPTLASMVGLRLWRVWQRIRGNAALSPRFPEATARVPWVTGAALLARRSAIAEVGPLDEAFFLYCEDADWCWRMHEKGWEVLLEPAAKVVHHLGGSAAPRAAVANAYRDSLNHYCDLRGLWGLKAVARALNALRQLLGGHA